MDNRLKVDTYTKVILTIIAFSLVMLNVYLFFSPAKADAYSSVIDVNLKSIDGNSIYRNIPVSVEEIKGNGFNRNMLNVNIEAINGNSIYGQEVPVKIK
ncbi:MAG TPA: hypothetical protein VFF33_09570 [Ignavibacteriaceae bacterium]|nr:hypothetical protein [Ignavibacteriaceae bacterium]